MNYMNLFSKSFNLTKTLTPIYFSSSSSVVPLHHFKTQQVGLGGCLNLQTRSFSLTSPVAFRKYLRDVPKPSAERNAEIDANLTAVKQFSNRADPNLTFDLFYPALRDPYLHRGAVLKMSRVALLLTKVENLDHLKEAIKLLKHLQRGGREFGRHVANNLVYAAIRIDAAEVVLDLLHRSVLDRNNIDEEPLFRIFPGPRAYEDLILTFLKKNDLAKAISSFSIATAQFRDNPDSSSSWNQVYYLGMLAYWKKKDFGDVKLIYQECLHQQLPELPGMILLLARIEATKQKPDLDLLFGFRTQLVNAFKLAESHVWWSEATALIAYAAQDTSIAQTIRPAYRQAVSKFLSTFLNQERLDQILPISSNE